MPHAPIARSRMLSFALVALAVSFGWMLLLFHGDAVASSLPKSCPSASSLQGTAGTSLKLTDSVAAKGSVICVYSGRRETSLTFSIIPLEGLSAAAFNALLKEEEQKESAIGVKSISGLGSAAAEFTEYKGKREANGNPDVALSVVVPNAEVIFESDLPASRIISVARRIVG